MEGTGNRMLKRSSFFLALLLLVGLLGSTASAIGPQGATRSEPSGQAAPARAIPDRERFAAAISEANDRIEASGIPETGAVAPGGISALADEPQYFFEMEVNDDYPQANAINDNYDGEPDYLAVGTINAYDDLDLYTFTTRSRGTVFLFGKWLDDLYELGYEDDLMIALINGNGNAVAFAEWVQLDESSNDTARYLEAMVPAGKYYVGVFQNQDSIYDYTGAIYGCILDFLPNFTVTYQSNGGTAVASVTADKGAVIARPADPVRAGYTFGGWFRDPDCRYVWNFDTDTVQFDTTLQAKWTINSYTVTFRDWDGSILKTQTVQHGQPAVAPTPAGRTGYTFDGWDKPFDSITADLTVTARYTAKTYVVLFKDWDGTELSSQTVQHGAAARPPATPTRTGHAFDGWDVPFGSITANLTVTAQYATIADGQCQVLFLDWNGVALKRESVATGGTVAAPAAPARTGHAFAGWNSAIDGSGTAFTDDAPVTESVTFYAQYTINKYSVTFNSNGGSTVAPVSADYGTTIAAPAAPAKTGYGFGGWYKEAALADDWNFLSDHVTASITLHAKWIPVSPQAKVRAFVERFYVLCLGREASGTEADGWVDALMTKRNSGADVGYGFVFSNEFKARNVSDEQFVTILYRAFFDREPDAGGYAAWLKTLANGMSRYSVLSGFTNSDEFSKLALSFGIERGTLVLSKPADLNPEVTAFVTRFYKLCLGRMPDEDGINAWVGNLKTGKSTGADVGYGFVFSNEFQNRSISNGEYVTILYRAFFDREPDTGGYAAWLGVLERGGTRYHVLTGFTNSIEFDKLCQNFGIIRGTLK